MRSNSPRRTAWFAMFAVLAGSTFLAACESQPEGYYKGRVPVSETTTPEQNSPQLLPAAMDEAATQITQQFAQDLLQFPPIRDAQTRVTVVMGDINNKTNAVSSDDFEYLGSAIRNRLLQSPFLRGRILFKENPARMAAIAGRENVAPPDPTPLDPKNTYTLNGNFYLIHRYANGQEVNQYSIEFQLVNFASGEILPVGSQYVVKQWHGRD